MTPPQPQPRPHPQPHPRYRWFRVPQGAESQAPRIEFGADYNPDQWPRAVWDEDVALMREAGVTVVAMGIFSWARLQPAPDVFDWDWFDDALGVVHEAGIGIELATATASPPPWLTAAHPEILPVDADGRTVWPGGRQHWRPTSPVFRRHALTLVEQMATRYGRHPGLVAWHVNNELGCHHAYDYSDDAAAAFRTWLMERYGSLDRLNEAWATSFWSQRYTDVSQVLPPRHTSTFKNPTQELDFARFSSDALLDYYRAERDVLDRLSPHVPVTTNIMVNGDLGAVDYAAWAHELDVVANDHYLYPDGRPEYPSGRDEMSFSANLTSGIAWGRPWFLQEHATSAVNWQRVNLAKRAGALERDALTHVGHGSDAVSFFQWRASRAGAEKYHSGLVPHAGEDSRLFRAVTALGARLRELGEVVGSRRASAGVGILFDWDSLWVNERDSHPSSSLLYRPEVAAWYTALMDAGIRADVVPLTRLTMAGLGEYPVLIAPVLTLVSDRAKAASEEYVHAGGHLVTTFFSGIVDEYDHIRLGGYPGAFTDLLGIRVEEFRPLLDHERVTISHNDDEFSARLWSEQVDVRNDDVRVLARYVGGDLDGLPAITRREVGGGSATYVSTRLDDGFPTVAADLAAHAGVASELPDGLRGAVELIVRRHDDGRAFWFVVNRTDDAHDLGELIRRHGLSLVSGGEILAPRGVNVLKPITVSP